MHESSESDGRHSRFPSSLSASIVRFRFVILAVWIIATLGRAALSIVLGVTVEELRLLELLDSHCTLLITGWVGVGVWPFLVSFAADRLDGRLPRSAA